MLNRKTISVTLVALVSIAGTFLYTMWQGNGPARIANRQAQVAKDLVKVTEPMTSSLRNFNPTSTWLVSGSDGFAGTFELLQIEHGQLGTPETAKVALVTGFCRFPLSSTART